MIPAPFDYHVPKTLKDALALLAQYGDDAKVLSGGQSLLPLLKLRLGQVEHLIDINRIPDLEYIREEDGFLKIGGRTRESALETSELVRTKYPLLYDTAKVIADPLVRNRATVGGNLAHGDPGNDHPAAMLALGARVVVAGANGDRTIPLTDFFLGLFTTALEPAEILTEIQVPEPPAGRSGGAYMKLERKVGDYATSASAAQITLSATGLVIEKAGSAITNAAPVPVHAVEAAAYLVEKPPTAENLAAAARMAAEATSPRADRRGSVSYKREMARVLTERALRKAVERAGGR